MYFFNFLCKKIPLNKQTIPHDKEAKSALKNDVT